VMQITFLTENLSHYADYKLNTFLFRMK